MDVTAQSPPGTMPGGVAALGVRDASKSYGGMTGTVVRGWRPTYELQVLQAVGGDYLDLAAPRCIYERTFVESFVGRS